jgi:hypothetical protein
MRCWAEEGLVARVVSRVDRGRVGLKVPGTDRPILIALNGAEWCLDIAAFRSMMRTNR